MNARNVSSLAAWRLVSTGMRTELTTGTPWIEPLEQWRAWMHAAGRPASTVYKRTYHLRRFALTSGLAPFEVTIDDLVVYLADQGWGGTTKRSVRSSLRGFYGWAVAVGRLERSPAALLPSVAVQPAHPRPAPDDAVAYALSHTSARIRLMVRLGVLVGLRASEISRVHTDDVYQNHGGWSLRVLGKGGKVRVIPIAGELARELRARPRGFVFPSQRGPHLSPGVVSKLLSQAMPEGVTAHQLRHRFASRAYRNGGHNLRAVQELLGHASVATTQVYTAVDDDELRMAALSAA